MGYQTILVHIDDTPQAAQRLALAASLAADEKGHLVCAAMVGLASAVYQYPGLVENDPNIAIHLAFLRQRAERAIQQASALLDRLAPVSCEMRVVDDEASAGMVLQARYADILILGQTDPGLRIPGVLPDFPEYVVFNAARPTLVVPHAGHFAGIGKRILVAWDASREAALAVSAALPLLQRAELVQVVAFNSNEDRATPGPLAADALAVFLARHGISVETLHRTNSDIGHALLVQAADFGADLIVMGAYGHSRFRETVLGGVTQTILKSMTVPVLLSH